jgi:single-strand DNA-binding protein
MAAANLVVLIGNLTRDVELRTAAGQSVTDLGLAVNDRVKRGDQWVDEATFLDVTVWGKAADFANDNLRKGSPVYIEGRLKLEEWTDKQGQKQRKVKVVCNRLQSLQPRGESKPVEDKRRMPAFTPTDDSDSPF